MLARTRRWVGQTRQPTYIRHVAWSPDGMRLASAGGGREGGELFVWEAHSGERLQALAEHPSEEHL